jgi:hypothetical protein
LTGVTGGYVTAELDIITPNGRRSILVCVFAHQNGSQQMIIMARVTAHLMSALGMMTRMILIIRFIVAA